MPYLANYSGALMLMGMGGVNLTHQCISLEMRKKGDFPQKLKHKILACERRFTLMETVQTRIRCLFRFFFLKSEEPSQQPCPVS